MTKDPLKGPIYKPPKFDCDVSDLTVAVYDQGTFRAAYGEKPKDGIAAWAVVDPVITQLKVQAVAARLAGKPLRILFFAHGGLVSHESAIQSAQNLAPAMMADGFAPVFLVWNSDFPTTYVDRLCCVRDGLKDNNLALFSTPSRLVGDVLAGVARSPQNFGSQWLRFNESVIRKTGTKYYLTPGEELPANEGPATESLCSALGGVSCPQVVFPAYDGSAPDRGEAQLNGRHQSSGREVEYALLFPARVVTTLVAPEGGAKAWDNMVRRTRLSIQRTSSVAAQVGPCVTVPDPNAFGGFAVFFDRLDCELAPAPPQAGAAQAPDGPRGIIDETGAWVPVELHFYGHSMGALVGNEVLGAYPQLPWTEVVYMAAASTIRDFRLNAVPALKQNKATPFYNLVLHPLNESRELFWGGVPPQGSLLEWIDEMFEGPRTPDERALGKWNNLKGRLVSKPEEPALYQAGPLVLMPADVRERMHIRVFAKALTPGIECGHPPIGVPEQAAPPRCHPVKHGQFNEYTFWRRSYLDGIDPLKR